MKWFIICALAFSVVSTELSSTPMVFDQKSNDDFILSGEVDIASLVVSPSELSRIADEIQRVQTQLDNGTITEAQAEQRMQQIVTPLRDSGRRIRDAVLSSMEPNGEYDMTSSEIDEMSDLDMVAISLIFSGLNQSHELNEDLPVSQGWTTDQIVGCISSALGITAVAQIISSTSSLGAVTTQGAIKIFKVVAKRYLGWIGVAFAAYQFVDCLASL